jgi:hypothetical protein
MEGLGQPAVRYETFPLGDSGGALLTMGCGYPGIDTAAEIARVDAYTPHVAEGINVEARNEFLCMRTGATDLVQPQSAFVHGVGLLPPDISEMATDGAALIWSPRSNVTLYGDTAHVTEYARLGVPIALGTDWIISGSMNMLRELRCADSLDANFYGDFFTDEASGSWPPATPRPPSRSTTPSGPSPPGAWPTSRSSTAPCTATTARSSTPPPATSPS